MLSGLTGTHPSFSERRLQQTSLAKAVACYLYLAIPTYFGLNREIYSGKGKTLLLFVPRGFRHVVRVPKKNHLFISSVSPTDVSNNAQPRSNVHNISSTRPKAHFLPIKTLSYTSRLSESGYSREILCNSDTGLNFYPIPTSEAPQSVVFKTSYAKYPRTLYKQVWLDKILVACVDLIS